uniref:AlNc14C18G1905 protein n=1 Tax=Albugo laibachii Nc14 TaxID=890382 RepID=F0W4T6_9STRA|nr:AlNc14C18G1905 [Albugo laibachii Nc14]|eukprot:CCA16123.1 AlNc14C18G1905 [Albugo laibachii Nc14]
MKRLKRVTPAENRYHPFPKHNQMYCYCHHNIYVNFFQSVLSLRVMRFRCRSRQYYFRGVQLVLSVYYGTYFCVTSAADNQMLHFVALCDSHNQSVTLRVLWSSNQNFRYV